MDKPMEDRSAADRALRLKAVARKKRATAIGTEAQDPTGARFWQREAQDAEEQAAGLLALQEPPEVGVGNELVPPGGHQGEHHYLVHTLTHPDGVAADASLERLNLAEAAGALTTAVDAAETIQARNSLEKMLAHQMAAAHGASMRLIARAEKELGVSLHQDPRVRHEAQLSASRLFNSAARMMSSFQDGMAALHKIRCGGRQVVTVQHVQVSDGGQAVVAGNLNGSTRGQVTGDGDEK